MSKAVLVMDMPESCDMCEITDMVNGKMYCSVPGCGELVEDYISCRPDFCPLRPIPEKKETYTTLECHTNGSWTDGMKSGWNACIDAIGGGDGE